MTKMVQKNTISNNVIGGIAAAVAAVFTLKTVVDYIQSMEYLPEYYTVGGLLWNLLTLAALAFLAVMLLMKKRSALIAVGFGVMAVGELRALLTPHLSFANRLAELRAQADRQKEELQTRQEALLKDQQARHDREKADQQTRYEKTLNDLKEQQHEQLEQQARLIKEQITTTTERILKERAAELSTTNKEQLSSILNPLHENLRQMKEAV